MGYYNFVGRADQGYQVFNYGMDALIEADSSSELALRIKGAKSLGQLPGKLVLPLMKPGDAHPSDTRFTVAEFVELAYEMNTYFSKNLLDEIVELNRE